MSKGKTIPCEHCKEILIRYAVFTGEGKFETLCPHCKKLVIVSFGQECWITIAKVTIALVIGAIVFLNYTILDPVKTETVDKDFATEIE